MVAIAAVVAAACVQVDRRRPGWGAPAAMASIVGLIAFDLLIGAPLQLNTTFGYSVAVAGRFTGLGNLAFALFGSATIVLAALIVDRTGPRGVRVALGLMAAVVVVEGLPMLGADVGGVLAMVPAFGVTALLLLGRRIRAREVVGLVVATGVVLFAFALVDAARPPEVQTHLARFAEQVFDGRWETFSKNLGRRWQASLGGAELAGWITVGAVMVLAWLYAVLVGGRPDGAPGDPTAPRPADHRRGDRAGRARHDRTGRQRLVGGGPADHAHRDRPGRHPPGGGAGRPRPWSGGGPTGRPVPARAGRTRGRRGSAAGGAGVVIRSRHPRPAAPRPVAGADRLGLLHSNDAVDMPMVIRLAGRIRAVLAAAVAVAVALVALAGPAGAQDADDTEREDTGIDRVLVVSVPGLTWAEVRDHDLPAIEGLLAESALADMAPRGVKARATPGAAYLTISAGTRAASDPLVDGQQLALGEHAGGSSAGEIFERRTGVRPDGSYVALAWPTLERVNAREPYDAELGLLTDTLAEADLGVEAIGNADGTDSVGTSYERQVGLAAATGDGVIPAGELDTDLLVRDPSRAFGLRLDIDQVDQRFRTAWETPADRDGGLVIVEASDLARSMRYRDRVDEQRYQELRSQALADTDDLVARLLEQVDPERDAVMLLAPYNLPGDRDLTVSARAGPRRRSGVHALGVDPALGLPDAGRRGARPCSTCWAWIARSRWRGGRPRCWRRITRSIGGSTGS